MPTPAKLFILIDQFRRNLDHYHNGGINEMTLRREYIDPLFALLGWDVDNSRGYSPAYREVVHEDTVEIDGRKKAPDYSFRIGGIRKFFVEAKVPARNLKDDWTPAFQLRRYGWNAKLPLCILTDFEEWAVYDCRLEPKYLDKAQRARIIYFTFEELPARWDELVAKFSPTAIQQGALDRLAEEVKTRKGTVAVDTVFLDEIEQWRKLLAEEIAQKNPHLSQRDINFVVQQTIDRIIFLRICEDRGIEHYGQLRGLAKGRNAYGRLADIFRHADMRYNSGLFHFQRERGRSQDPDGLSLDVKISDETLHQIFGRLYPPESPYEFAIFPADVLGQVYERFLGNVIVLNKDGAEIIEKPEVKHAGGVYYTPTYIVNSIVEETIGKVLYGKTPAQIAGDSGNVPLRILDPACGSGSFLLGAYQKLLDWHLDWYSKNDPEKWAAKKMPPIYEVVSSDRLRTWKLTTSEKRRILLNNLFGVDIDSQAVEVTKLSLLLKLLEDENEQTVGKQLKITDRVLPDLESNIKCGNSLIGPDFFDQDDLVSPDSNVMYRVNVFDWAGKFPDTMRNGGFHIIIGNPPYIRIQELQKWAVVEAEYYNRRYSAASEGGYDIYVVFIERALELLRRGGQLGFIVPNRFLNVKYGKPLRALLSAGHNVKKIVSFGCEQVFDGATTYTCLLFLGKEPVDVVHSVNVSNLQLWRTGQERNEGVIPSSSLSDSEWHLAVGIDRHLLNKLNACPLKLEDVTDRIFQGIKTSADKIYIVEERKRKGRSLHIYSRQLDAEFIVEPDLFHTLVKGGDSKRYYLSSTSRLILFPYESAEEGWRLIPADRFRYSYPKTWDYLCANKKYLEEREHGKMRGLRWYGYIYPKALGVISEPKIFTPDIALHASYSLDETGEAYFTGGTAGGYGIVVSSKYSREYILGLLNSRLLEWFIRKTATVMSGCYYSYESRFIKHLPIRGADPGSKGEQKVRDQVVRLVERLLSLNKVIDAAKTPFERDSLREQRDATDAQLDRLIYELYELTPEEIEAVELETERKLRSA